MTDSKVAHESRAGTEPEIDKEANESDDDVDVTEDVTAVDGEGAKKKKKKKKKKKCTDNGAEEANEVPVDAVETVEAPGETAGADSEDEEEAEEGGAAPSNKKKKKKKKKKPGVIEMVDGSGDAGVTKYCPDQEFAHWVENALEATKNGSEETELAELLKPPKPFWGYSYSGSLRPAFVTPQMRMPSDWAMPDYATHPEGVSACEREKLAKVVPEIQGQELGTMREACKLGREVLDIAGRFMKVGVTGDQIDRIVWQACFDRKIYPSPLNYYRFPKSVCVSPNEVICHGIPDCRPLEEGEIVNLDVSIYYKGFHSDLNETFFIGKCDDDAHRLVRTAYCALYQAASLIRPGTLYRDLGNVIHAEAVKNNCAVVTTYCGHGIGELFHGPPKVPHYRKNKAVGLMKPGHVFTIEPMINLGSNGADNRWPDNWTAVTKDGKRSAQFEHTFIVTETGYEVLTRRRGTDPFVMPPYDPAMFQR
mmetsp:Transcript_44150/g.116871  ORF Transcript_44150/g.116871 Transcript_44150/m.116871 type:complete len:478 (-) Transcript_44150:74-1507(-)